MAEVDRADLAPVRSQSEYDLLSAANDAFRLANDAQEQNDQEAALRHYNRMLELLVEADLDPTLYYNLRKEFERILASTAELVKNAQNEDGSYWAPQAMEFSVRSQLDFPNPLNQRVLDEIHEIQKGYSRSFQIGLTRSSQYLPFIREEMRRAGLPEDLAWLAMVESQFQPKINSPVGAGGMWQFMPGTARRYGLRIDYYVDERYDWKKATRAAIAYLSDLHKMFDGNWPLAVSAYNKGEYGIERAVTAAGGERNLWRLMESPGSANHLPRETKKFYPRLLASIIVAKNPQRYGFDKPRIEPEHSAYTQVAGSYSLRDLEKASNLPADTLKKLNPQYLRGITPPGGTSEVHVPTNAGIQLASVMESVPEYQADTHVVQRGETLARIAKRYGVRVEDLMDTNSIKSARGLQVGQRLAVPRGSAAVESRIRVASSTPSTYSVKKGDTLAGIAQKHGVELDTLLAANKLDRSTPIYVGDTLNLHTASTPTNDGVALAKATEDQRKSHVVLAGQTAGQIAQLYGVRTADLQQWNNLNNKSVLHIGQELTVYAPDRASPNREVKVAKANTGQNLVQHIVKIGQSPFTIAKRYGVKLVDLFHWNEWNNDPVLQVGETVLVYAD